MVTICIMIPGIANHCRSMERCKMSIEHLMKELREMGGIFPGCDCPKCRNFNIKLDELVKEARGEKQ